MTNYDALSATLELIEERIQEKITVEQLAKQVYLSTSHLQKLFRHVTGQSLMDYVRGRKLAFSLYALQKSNLRIIDIARDYGFEHEQSFARAFKAEYGCSPGVARSQQKILTLRPPITHDQFSQVEDGILCKPEIAFVPEMKIIGRPHMLANFTTEKDGYLPNHLGKAFYYDDMPRIKNALEPEVYLAYGTSIQKDNNDVLYMPSVRVRSLGAILPGMKGEVIPPHLCAKFRYIGQHHYQEISMIAAHETYAGIEAFFASQSRFIRVKNWYLERIDIRLYDGTFCQFDWMAPVRDTANA